MKPSILYAFDKVRKAIISSTTMQQLAVANRMRCNFDDMFIYGRLAKSNDSSRFYADKLMTEWVIKIEKLNETN
jgi:hypothetical protein